MLSVLDLTCNQMFGGPEVESTEESIRIDCWLHIKEGNGCSSIQRLQ